MEKSEVMSKDENENKKIREALLNSLELKVEKSAQLDKEIKQIKQELGLPGD